VGRGDGPNTDSISVTGATGSNARAVLDLREHELGPGAASGFNLPEIELDTALGDETDTFVIYGTAGDDFLSPGQNGLAPNAATST
jgi:hypothetical protein